MPGGWWQKAGTKGQGALNGNRVGGWVGYNHAWDGDSSIASRRMRHAAGSQNELDGWGGGRAAAAGGQAARRAGQQQTSEVEHSGSMPQAWGISPSGSVQPSLSRPALAIAAAAAARSAASPGRRHGPCRGCYRGVGLVGLAAAGVMPQPGRHCGAATARRQACMRSK